MTEHFGILPSERLALENETCRGIVKEIIDFGVTQRQLMLTLYLLALQLEDNDAMRTITSTVKELAPDAFISSQPTIGNEDAHG